MDAGNNSSSANLSIAIGRELDVCEDDRENGGLSTSTFIVGSEFHSFDEVSSAIKDYECVNSVTLYTRSSRSIMAAKKRAPKRHFSENLKYSELDYACVHGGRQYKSHSKGIRKSQRLVVQLAFITTRFAYMLQYISEGMPIYYKNQNIRGWAKAVCKGS